MREGEESGGKRRKGSQEKRPNGGRIVAGCSQTSRDAPASFFDQPSTQNRHLFKDSDADGNELSGQMDHPAPAYLVWLCRTICILAFHITSAMILVFLLIEKPKSGKKHSMTAL